MPQLKYKLQKAAFKFKGIYNFPQTNIKKCKASLRSSGYLPFPNW